MDKKSRKKRKLGMLPIIFILLLIFILIIVVVWVSYNSYLFNRGDIEISSSEEESSYLKSLLVFLNLPNFCFPTNCFFLGKKCGTWPNGCGKYINCGTCSAGYYCNNGTCLIQKPLPPCTNDSGCSSVGSFCDGNIPYNCSKGSDGCLDRVNKASCLTNQVCNNGACQNKCTPNCTGKVCGNDGCGGSCGSCNAGYTCNNGSCVTLCNYIINPGESINKYSSIAQPGEKVCIKAGTYNETLTPKISGTPGNLITFKAYPGDECKRASGKEKTCKVIFNGSRITNEPIAIQLTNKDYIRIEGFEITSWGWENIYFTNSHYLEIINNLIHDGTNAAITNYPDYTSSHNILIENNTVHDQLVTGNETKHNSPRAFWLSGSNITIRNNIVYHNGDDAIMGSGNNWLIEGNDFSDSHDTFTHQDAMAIQLANSIIRYNTLSDFTQLIYFNFVNGNNGRVENLDIYGNVFYNNLYFPGLCPGIFFSASSKTGHTIRNVSIHSNTFGYLGMGSILLDSNINDPTRNISSIKIYDNIFYEKGIEVTPEEADKINSDYNLFYLPSAPSFEGLHSIIGQNPQFVNYTRHVSHDFHLKGTSPAINAGNPSLGTVVKLPKPFVDIDGNTRPSGSNYDIGAYEYYG